MKEEGNISEDVYDDIGLPKDFNYKGKLFIILFILFCVWAKFYLVSDRGGVGHSFFI